MWSFSIRFFAMLRLRSGLLSAATLIAGLLPATAADTRSVAFAPTTIDGYIVTVRVNAVTSPRWQGASLMSAIAYPSMSFRKASETPKFASPDDAIGFGIIKNDQFSIGPAFRYRSGRYDGGDKDLRGLHDVRWTVESGVYADVWINPNLRARGEIRRGFREKDGFTANLGLDLVNSFNSWTVAIGPRLAISDGSFMRHNFGVTQRDALLNPRLKPYVAKAGFKSVGLYASASYKFNEAWTATLHGGYDRLVAAAASSPVVKSLGSVNQMMVGFQLSYSFPVKGF